MKNNELLFRWPTICVRGSRPVRLHEKEDSDAGWTGLIMRCMMCLVLVSGFFFYSVSSGRAQTSSPGSSSAESVYAADFTLKDLNGKDVRLNDFKGKVILLSFSATWCQDCKNLIPVLKTIHHDYSKKGLILLNINIQETQAKVAAYSRKNGLPYPTLLDSDGTVSRKFGVGGVPVLALIDRQGRITCWNCRSLNTQLEKQFAEPGK